MYDMQSNYLWIKGYQEPTKIMRISELHGVLTTISHRLPNLFTPSKLNRTDLFYLMITVLSIA